MSYKARVEPSEARWDCRLKHVQVEELSAVPVLLPVCFLPLLPVQTPALTIASNAGAEGAVIVGKLLEQTNLDWGFDASKGTKQLVPTQAHSPPAQRGWSLMLHCLCSQVPLRSSP